MGQAVTMGAMLQCIFSPAPGTLVVLPMSKILINNKPAANIMDGKPFVNIPPFPICTSPANPLVIASLGAPSACTPMTMAPWIVGAPTVMAGTGPILNNSAKLICAYGGMISITFPGQVTTMTP